ncbi:hypothetical protein KVR01_002318 [Diaporthe batatas]|uniref:uncharacterized protein n=1 Tax=Diaporthe batatas TaxID=748121 RepID=UPI001D04B3E9|nr:uncharacterized protein KVR01_002318 [Diaporthe batatas]KAG8166629.1 hypothetical protein KVR01_002318 [Diaporthe batatas]
MPWPSGVPQGSMGAPRRVWRDVSPSDQLPPSNPDYASCLSMSIYQPACLPVRPSLELPSTCRHDIGDLCAPSSCPTSHITVVPGCLTRRSQTILFVRLACHAVCACLHRSIDATEKSPCCFSWASSGLAPCFFPARPRCSHLGLHPTACQRAGVPTAERRHRFRACLHTHLGPAYAGATPCDSDPVSTEADEPSVCPRIVSVLPRPQP